MTDRAIAPGRCMVIDCQARSTGAEPDPGTTAGSQLRADENRLVVQRDAVRLLHPSAHLTGEIEQLGGRRPATVRQCERMLGRQGDRAVTVAAAVARVVDQPCRARLDAPVWLLEPRRIGWQPRGIIGGQDRVGEERTGAPRVVVVLVEDHAFAAPQSQHGLAYVARLRTLALRYAEPARQFGVPHWRLQLAALEPELHREHHVPAGFGLEPAGAVREAAVARGECANPALGTVIRADVRDRLRDLLPVRADLLRRVRSHESRDARARLGADPLLVHGAVDDRTPFLTRGDGHGGATRRIGGDADATRTHQHDGAGESVVGGDDVAPATEYEHGLTAGVGFSDGCDDLVLARDLDEPARRTTQTQRGQCGELDVALLTQRTPSPSRAPSSLRT